ncbi:hypothetical protein IH799_02760 [candidate division KSB1 bacterium]|nr:hypothetical protein [candidate division KSB1 bacterium]
MNFLSKSFVKIFLGAVVFILLLLLIGGSVALPMNLFLGAIGGALSYIVIDRLTKSKESKQPKQDSPDTSEEPAPKETVPEYVRYAENLVVLQGQLRSDPYRIDDIVIKAETIISKLMDVLEKINTDVELSKISFAVEVNMIAEDYLPERVLRKSYLQLFPEDREEHVDEVSEMLTTLDQELDTALENIRNRRLSDLDHQARFFKKKFQDSREIKA